MAFTLNVLKKTQTSNHNRSQMAFILNCIQKDIKIRLQAVMIGLHIKCPPKRHKHYIRSGQNWVSDALTDNKFVALTDEITQNQIMDISCIYYIIYAVPSLKWVSFCTNNTFWNSMFYYFSSAVLCQINWNWGYVNKLNHCNYSIDLFLLFVCQYRLMYGKHYLHNI